jgi:hypothetical protein
MWIQNTGKSLWTLSVGILHVELAPTFQRVEKLKMKKIIGDQ